MGRNGSGKSTLLKIASGIYTPDTGGSQSALASRRSSSSASAGTRTWMRSTTSSCSGRSWGCRCESCGRAATRSSRSPDLERFAHLELRHYSSGMGARLAYAVAFHAVRETLILDEIFAVGDAGFKERCEDRFDQLHRAGHSMLVVSHEPRTICDFCDRAILLDQGRIVMNDVPARVTDRYMSLLTDTPERAVAS